jgi:hypothetical protein
LTTLRAIEAPSRPIAETDRGSREDKTFNPRRRGIDFGLEKG